MDIKNSKEIITEFVSRSSFVHIYSDPNLTFNISDELSSLSTKEGLDFLFASALIGNRVIGFFEELPYFKLDKYFRGDCIIILMGLPKMISAPTLFCRKLEDLPKALNVALKLATEIRFPVVISISHNVFNNFTISERYYYDPKTVPSTLSSETFRNVCTEEDLTASYKKAYEVLSQEMPNDPGDYSELSFKDSTKPFFSYLLPYIFTHDSSHLIAAYPSEIKLLQAIFASTYNVHLEFSELVERESYKVKSLLCAGCPFVNIFSRVHDNETVYFTDIKCRAVLEKYKMTMISIDSYFGLLSRNLNTKTMMISRASAFNLHYEKLLKPNRMILLNDTGVKAVSGFASIKHPKKVKSSDNILFPYSCYNIKKYGKIKIKKARCKCVNEASASCINITNCNALYISDGKVSVNSHVCTGCLACAVKCKNGAIV